VKTFLVQRGGERETRYSSANDQNPLDIGHVSSLSPLRAARILGR
jgi:hypothetical protein